MSTNANLCKKKYKPSPIDFATRGVPGNQSRALEGIQGGDQMALGRLGGDFPLLFMSRGFLEFHDGPQVRTLVRFPPRMDAAEDGSGERKKPGGDIPGSLRRAHDDFFQWDPGVTLQMRWPQTKK
jgi:hypothetical protein